MNASPRKSFGIVLLVLLFVVESNAGLSESIEVERNVVEPRSLKQKESKEDTASRLCANQSPKQIFSCKPYFKHSTQRLANASPLYAGEATCHNEFMFGVTKDGVFQWANCAKNKTKVFYDAGSDDVYFEMQADASWNVYERSTGNLLWKQECELDVQLYPQCLSYVNLDCPYIHLRKSGRIVMNSIDKDGRWVASNSPNVYNLWDDEE